MKNLETYKVVMLPTEKAFIFINSDNKLNINHSDTFDCNTFQHLYIIRDEEIKEGDWFIANNILNKSILRVTEIKDNAIFFGKEWINKVNCSKIIASTDKSITPNSWIPDSFVKAYIESYNNSKPILDILLSI